jgi:hypothetical protein
MDTIASLPARRRHRVPGVTVLLVLVTLVGGGILLGPLGVLRGGTAGAPGAVVPSPADTSTHARSAVPTAAPRTVARTSSRAATGEVHGVVTVFDEENPAVANLDPHLLAALQAAATTAKADGIVFRVNSGWRSAAYQAQLLREAVARYGSVKEAERWVASPATSAHVSGDAVDLGPTATDTWLARHGAAYGLCPVYRNEPWHYELRPSAMAEGCPAMYADASQDPRLHR